MWYTLPKSLLKPRPTECRQNEANRFAFVKSFGMVCEILNVRWAVLFNRWAQLGICKWGKLGKAFVDGAEVG